MEPMFIEELEEYAQKYGFDSGRFLYVGKKGIAEFKWLDAYFGFVLPIKDGEPMDGFITTAQIKEFFGRDAKYIPTIGYDVEDVE